MEPYKSFHGWSMKILKDVQLHMLSKDKSVFTKFCASLTASKDLISDTGIDETAGRSGVKWHYKRATCRRREKFKNASAILLIYVP